MPAEYVATELLVLTFQNPAHTGIIDARAPLTAVYIQDSITFNQVGMTISNGSDGAGITSASGLGVLVGSAEKVLVKNIEPPFETAGVVRVGDEVDILMTGVTGSGSPASYTTTVYVQDAGQDKVKAV